MSQPCVRAEARTHLKEAHTRESKSIFMRQWVRHEAHEGLL